MSWHEIPSRQLWGEFQKEGHKEGIKLATEKGRRMLCKMKLVSLVFLLQETAESEEEDLREHLRHQEA